ncbi:PREDICTED: immunoglobulin superfamily member 1, partial [Bison bison bison]|uniref:immunoglobulin superfamily member 1 n=1 Tax=Bison bison bison TaxID=43346 RepID=UPI00057649EA
MTLDRPGEGATMLRTFTLLLFCAGLSLGVTPMVMPSQPELWIESNYPQAPWENITLWCKSPSQISSKFLLLKDKTQMTWIRPSRKTFQVSFPIGALTQANTGLYRCCYWKETGWSEPSKVLELEAPGQLPKPIFWIQTETSPLPGCNVNILCHGWLQDLVFMLFKGLYPKPTLTAYPGPIMAPGESLNLRCQGPIYGMTFALIRLEDLEKSFYLKRPIKNEAYFFFRALKIHDAGHYLCFYYDGSYRGSLLSDILKIWNVSLWCRGPVDGVGLALYKKGEDKPLQLLDTTSIYDDTSFFLNNVTSSDAGIYSCHYLLSWKTSIRMTSHNTVELVVVDKPPKPSLSAWPSTVFKLGKAITLQCRVPHPVLEFCLEWEERATSQKFSVYGDFIISNVEGKGTGTYSCSYRIEAHPNIWSHRSEPLKLMGPAGFLTWNHVLNETIRLFLIIQLVALLFVVLWIRWKCRRLRIREAWLLGTAQGVTMLFILTALLCCGLCTGVLTEETEIIMPTPKPELWAETNFPLAPWKNLTLYILPKPVISASPPIRGKELQIRCKGWLSEFYPKPTLLAHPGPVVLPGKNVTLRCQGAFQGMRFALLQEGTPGPLQFRSASGNSADFLLHTVGAEDSGNYSCVYFETTMSNRGSYLSKPLMIWVTDTFPKPRLFAEPSSVVPVGQNVTLWCQGPVHGVGYILHKEIEATSVQLWGSTSNDGAFPITNVSGASIGRYSCCYHPDWTSLIKIQPSNTLELIVTGLLPKPSLLAQPGPMVAPGENMTLQCQGELADSTFVLL